MSSVEETKHLQIPLQDISSATNDFAKENYIGSGGFGKVYKGISEKHGPIAVKRLDRDRGEHSQGDYEFKTEIALLSIYKHENIVSLLGFCDEDGERILVYKYESNGSLDKHLENTSLTWTQRLMICLEAAIGLRYLHEDVAPQHRIFHRDVKSANILLDENWKAKISDFGLSKVGPAHMQSSFVISNACGTLGYIDPEYFYTGQLTPKSDVFSFGVVLFEVLCGRRAFLKVDGQFFFVWVQKHYKRRTLDKVIPPDLHKQMKTASLHKFSSIAYRCLSIGEERPTMFEVVKELVEVTEHQLTPDGPWFNVYAADLRRRQLRLQVVAEFRNGDLSYPSSVVSSIEFDRDDEFMATAGSSRCIRVFEFASVVNENTDVQCPIVEMPTRSKLSSLSWNKYAKNHIASSDYEGVITLWDVNAHQSVMEFKGHEKRAWSVDFSCTEPTMLASGSDDYKVKIWNTNEETSVIDIDVKANVCSVKYHPESSFHVAVGSAYHHIHYYDLRNTSQPLHMFRGHQKAVSYVKFISNSELVSASVDSKLCLWDLNKETPLLREFRAHTNERNFVGLAVKDEYIACGSETNEVFVYQKDLSRPVAWHRFSSETDTVDKGARECFISAVCWTIDSPATLLAANSEGKIKVLDLDV